MFLNKNLSDFEIKTSDDETFCCHKVVLFARSPMFFGMLSHDTKENQESSVEVTEDAEIMKEVLRFIYCNDVEDIDEKAVKLIIAADKYHLSTLKEMCVDSIIDELSEENVVEALEICHLIPETGFLFTECLIVVNK